MTKEQLTHLLAYIDMAIAAVMARDSEDGGLLEIVRMNEIRDELFATLERSEDDRDIVTKARAFATAYDAASGDEVVDGDAQNAAMSELVKAVRRSKEPTHVR